MNGLAKNIANRFTWLQGPLIAEVHPGNGTDTLGGAVELGRLKPHMDDMPKIRHHQLPSLDGVSGAFVADGQPGPTVRVDHTWTTTPITGCALQIAELPKTTLDGIFMGIDSFTFWPATTQGWIASEEEEQSLDWGDVGRDLQGGWSMLV